MQGSVLFSSTTTIDHPAQHSPRKHRSPRKSGPRYQQSADIRKPSRAGSSRGLLCETSPLQSPACESFGFGSESDHVGEHRANLIFSMDDVAALRDEAMLTQVLLNMLDQEDDRRANSESTHEHHSFAYEDTLPIPPVFHQHRRTSGSSDDVASTGRGLGHHSIVTHVSHEHHHHHHHHDSPMFPPSAYLGYKRSSSTSLEIPSMCGSGRQSITYPASASSACDCCASASFSLDRAYDHDILEAGNMDSRSARETPPIMPNDRSWPFFYALSPSGEAIGTPQPSSICIPSMLQEANWAEDEMASVNDNGNLDG
jgi:hypothetical protein